MSTLQTRIYFLKQKLTNNFNLKDILILSIIVILIF